MSSEKKNVHCFSMSTVRSYLFYKSNVEGENGIIDKSNIYFLSYFLNVQIEKTFILV